MKNLELATYGVVELNEVEMMEIDGGRDAKKLFKAIHKIVDAAEAVWDWWTS